MHRTKCYVVACALLVAGLSPAAEADTVFTYQGQLDHMGAPFTGAADIRFHIWTEAHGGARVGEIVSYTDLAVTNGLFTVELDFGADALNSGAEWLQIDARLTGSGAQYQPLSPRQRITSAPYAVRTRGLIVDAAGDVGIGLEEPGTKVHIVEDASGITYPLKVDNPHPVTGEDGVGILFSTGGSGGGPVSPERGKGALVYEYAHTWNRGHFHVLQNSDTSSSTPTLSDSVFTITNDGNVGVGTTAPAGLLALGAYTGGTEGSLAQTYNKQLVLGGAFNEGPNTGESVKLHICEYDNDPGSDIFPMYVEDENNLVHFYLRNLGGQQSAYFGGNVGVGTDLPTNALSVAGDANVLGSLAIGTSTPELPLLVVGGGDANPISGGYVQVGQSSARNLALDDNEIMARSDGVGATLHINRDGGDIILAETGDNVGIGTVTTEAKLHVHTGSGVTVYGDGGTTGVMGYGSTDGGVFADTNGSGYARLGVGDEGIRAKGTDGGGYFYDEDGSGKAWIAFSDDEDREKGLQAEGNKLGGLFYDADGMAEARVAYSGSDGHDYGIWAYANNVGGYFEDHMGSYTGCASGPSSTYGNGEKNFVQNHPLAPEKVIVYSSLEGDEVATFTRGLGRLVNGKATVRLGETFQWVTNPDIGLTAHLTPLDDCAGLYVASISTTELTIRELGGGTSNASFAYMAFGLRIGFEESSRVRSKMFESKIPSFASIREDVAAHPELARHCAKHRYLRMHTDVGHGAQRDFSASDTLIQAIGIADGTPQGLRATENLRTKPRPTTDDHATVSSPATPAHRDSVPPSVETQQAEEIRALRQRLERLEALVDTLTQGGQVS